MEWASVARCQPRLGRQLPADRPGDYASTAQYLAAPSTQFTTEFRNYLMGDRGTITGDFTCVDGPASLQTVGQ